MNIYMLKKEIKYLLKNTIFYLGIIIVICTLVLTLKPYLNLYENVREENSKIVYGDEGIINIYQLKLMSKENRLLIEYTNH